MTRSKTVAIVVAAGALVGGFFLRPLEPVTFRNRMVVRAPGWKRIFYRPPKRAEVDTYTRSVDQALLIRALSAVDTPAAMGPGFTFPEIAAKAFAPAGITDSLVIDQKFRDWADTPTESAVFFLLNPAWAAGGTRTAANLPLRLLAVVNRLDLGVVGCEGIDGCAKPGKPVCSAGHICGAEVRFVYAGFSGSHAPFFTLIMEFTFQSLAKQDFLNLANQWAGLGSIANPETPAFAANVGNALRFGWSLPGGGVMARMRINARTNDGQWKLRQYMFTPGGIVAVPLFQQLGNEVQATNSCQFQGAVFSFATASSNHDAILQGVYSAPAEPEGFNLMLPSGTTGRGVLTLASAQPPAADLDLVRHSISVNSCSGCHGWEARKVVEPQSALSQAPFDQIQYREPGARSKISAFLAGTKSGAVSLEPTLDTWEMRPPTISDATHGCTVRAGEVSYNDLRRRQAFAGALLSLTSSQSDTAWALALANVAVSATD